MCVCVCVQILLRESSHLCVREDPACVCACVQQAPIGMNYLEESLFYLSTVGWPRARKVLLPTTQETTLIHHPPLCSMPPSRPPTQVLPACSSVSLQMSPLIVALASWWTVYPPTRRTQGARCFFVLFCFVLNACNRIIISFRISLITETRQTHTLRRVRHPEGPAI